MSEMKSAVIRGIETDLKIEDSRINIGSYIITQLLWYIIIKFQLIFLMTYSFSGRSVP